MEQNKGKSAPKARHQSAKFTTYKKERPKEFSAPKNLTTKKNCKCDSRELGSIPSRQSNLAVSPTWF